MKGQESVHLSGTITTFREKPLPGASIRLSPGNRGAVAGDDGKFKIHNLSAGEFIIEVSFIGFQPVQDTVSLTADREINIVLKEKIQTLQEVMILDNYAQQRNKEEPLNVEIVNDDFLKQHLGGSLMQSLERLPGISAIDIGAGQSKPIIRGLGFNRVVVVENGIKHEAQQWGADHGLEVDQFAFDRIEVIKGPSSLMYGSDAIGGVIDLKQVEVPQKKSLGANINLTGKSNNDLAGTSVLVYGRQDKLFFTLRGTLIDFADYRVPADSIDIYSYRAPLHRNRLRNTAGREKNLYFSAGYQNNGTSARLFVSNVSAKQGFFANTHGLEPRRVDTDMHDASDRDIHMPFQEVNHFKAMGRIAVQKETYYLRTEVGFQRNNRQEWSPYTRHGFMPATVPAGLKFPPELERQYIKAVYSVNATAGFHITPASELSSGINAGYQEHDIDGRGFIIPAYNQLNAGGYLLVKHKLPGAGRLQAGIRYDQGKLTTRSYFDWYTTPVTTDEGIADSMLQRAPALKRNFSSFTWSIGYNLNNEHFSFKANAGKSFRMPIAKELAANGINYHRFSYEKGNPELSPEISYQLDAGMELHTHRFAIGITPFGNYFPNYIYLNPGYEHDRLYGNGNQVFSYTQSKVMRLGGELHSHYDIIPQLKTGLIVNYIWSEQLSGSKKGFTLPFSPPASGLLNLKYLPQITGLFRLTYASLDIKLTAAQNRIVPPEEKTPGYTVLNFSAGTELKVKNHPVSFSFQVQNLLNKKYFNHTSYYRLINVPGPGRNLILNINIPI
ncbi:MAG: TonB-dependent receptor [Mariniphaga sp.]